MDAAEIADRIALLFNPTPDMSGRQINRLYGDQRRRVEELAAEIVAGTATRRIVHRPPEAAATFDDILARLIEVVDDYNGDSPHTGSEVVEVPIADVEEIIARLGGIYFAPAGRKTADGIVAAIRALPLDLTTAGESDGNLP